MEEVNNSIGLCDTKHKISLIFLYLDEYCFPSMFEIGDKDIGTWLCFETAVFGALGLSFPSLSPYIAHLSKRIVKYNFTDAFHSEIISYLGNFQNITLNFGILFPNQ